MLLSLDQSNQEQKTGIRIQANRTSQKNLSYSQSKKNQDLGIGGQAIRAGQLRSNQAASDRLGSGQGQFEEVNDPKRREELVNIKKNLQKLFDDNFQALDFAESGAQFQSSQKFPRGHQSDELIPSAIKRQMEADIGNANQTTNPTKQPDVVPVPTLKQDKTINTEPSDVTEKQALQRERIALDQVKILLEIEKEDLKKKKGEIQLLLDQIEKAQLSTH